MSRDRQPLRVRPITYDERGGNQQRRRDDRAAPAKVPLAPDAERVISLKALFVMFLCAAAVGGGLASLFGVSVDFAA